MEVDYYYIIIGIVFVFRALFFFVSTTLWVSLNDPALYVLKLEYVEPFFIMRNNTRALRYSKIEYVNKGKKVKPSFL